MDSRKPKKGYSQGKFDPQYPIVTQSWLTLHEACAFAAFMRYIEGKKDQPNAHATIGQAVDAGLTHGAIKTIETGKDASLAEKLEHTADEFDRREKETRFFPDLTRVRSKEIALKLVELHHKKIAPTLKPVEAQVTVRVDFPNYAIAGKLDLVEEGDRITDYKSANRSGKYLVHCRAQPAHYSKLYMHRYGRKPALFRNVVLLKKKSPDIEVNEARVTEHDQEVHHYRMRAAIFEMQNSIKSGYFRLAEESHWRCDRTGKWCPYLYAGCPKGKVFRGVKK